MVPYFIFTFGLFLRAVYVTIFTFKKSDLLVLGGALLVGLFVAARLAEESQTGATLNPGLGLVFGFSLIIAFAFKERICPVAGEGLLLLYGFLGSYIFATDFLVKGNGGTFIIWGTFFLVAYGAITVTTAVTSGRLSKGLQAIHMVLYLIMSIGIGIWLMVQGLSEVYSSWGLVLLGYSSLTLISNIHYVLHLVPTPRNFSKQMKDIREHAHFLESKYISTDLSPLKFLLIVASIGLLIVFDAYTQISSPVLIAFILTFGSVVFRPPVESLAFTPKSVH